MSPKLYLHYTYPRAVKCKKEMSDINVLQLKAAWRNKSYVRSLLQKSKCISVFANRCLNRKPESNGKEVTKRKEFWTTVAFIVWIRKNQAQCKEFLVNVEMNTGYSKNCEQFPHTPSERKNNTSFLANDNQMYTSTSWALSLRTCSSYTYED